MESEAGIAFIEYILGQGTFADVTANVDDIDVGHINLMIMHIVQHGLGAFCLYFIVSAMTQKTDADDDVAF